MPGMYAWEGALFYYDFLGSHETRLSLESIVGLGL